MTAYDVDAVRVLTERRRLDLLDRLVRVFLAQGFAAFSMQDLALRCHCSLATLLALAPERTELERAVLAHFFAGTEQAIEARVAAVPDPRLRPGEYLAGVAAALAPASNAFFRDLERCVAGRQVYEASTRRAATRVHELLRDGVRSGRLRDVQASFVGDTVSAVTARISSGAVLLSTGLDDARAFSELATLVAVGLSA